jgi:hypothetical protein
MSIHVKGYIGQRYIEAIRRANMKYIPFNTTPLPAGGVAIQ